MAAVLVVVAGVRGERTAAARHPRSDEDGATDWDDDAAAGEADDDDDGVDEGDTNDEAVLPPDDAVVSLSPWSSSSSPSTPSTAASSSSSASLEASAIAEGASSSSSSAAAAAATLEMALAAVAGDDFPPSSAGRSSSFRRSPARPAPAVFFSVGCCDSHAPFDPAAAARAISSCRARSSASNTQRCNLRGADDGLVLEERSTHITTFTPAEPPLSDR